MMQRALLTKGHHFFGNNTRRFGLGQSSDDFLFLDEAAHHVGKHRIAVLSGAAQLGSSYSMSHGLRVAGCRLFLIPERRILERFRRGCHGQCVEQGRVYLFAEGEFVFL